ncbi:MAG: hypothetical protein KBD01_02005 [Acidobacteria bacterium]|nr:hypothetical protein [Acidobacteriota bacterium]
MTDRDKVIEALRLLADLVDGRIADHPWGHLVPRRGSRVDLRIGLPVGASDEDLERLAEQALATIQRSLAGLAAHAAAFRPGRVYCLRCRRPDCEHSLPADPRHVFAGYGPSGVPRFADYGQLLLDRHDERIEWLYETPPRLAALRLDEPDLVADLLPAFRAGEGEPLIHGQVSAGWYRAPDPAGRDQMLAVTVQVLSSRPPGGARRFAVNVVGVGPGGETLEQLHDRLGHTPWLPAVRWAQTVLHDVEASARGRRPAGPAAEALARRLDGLLGGIARRLEHGERARDRRTHHAQVRHGEGSRPTRMAVADLARAREEQLLFDERRQTLVVVGERGRVHMFNFEGKLVTSVRYPPATIQRRRETGLWRSASREEVAAVRAAVS